MHIQSRFLVIMSSKIHRAMIGGQPGLWARAFTLFSWLVAHGGAPRKSKRVLASFIHHDPAAGQIVSHRVGRDPMTAAALHIGMAGVQHG